MRTAGPFNFNPKSAPLADHCGRRGIPSRAQRGSRASFSVLAILFMTGSCALAAGHPRIENSASVVETAPAEPLADAMAALEEGIPQVAIVKLQRYLAGAQSLEPSVRTLAKTKLAEALLAAGRIDDALHQSQDPEVQAPLLQARINAAAGRWREALSMHEAAPMLSDSTTILFRAECLWQLGQGADAIILLERFGKNAPSAAQLRLAEFYLERKQLKRCEQNLREIHPATCAERQWKRYVEGRLFLAQGQPADAFARFEEVQRDPEDLSENLIIGSTLGMTEARAQLSGLIAADDICEFFISKHPASPQLGVIFRKLDEIYAAEDNASRSELEKWCKSEPAWRAAFARYYLAKQFLREGREDQVLRALDKFSELYPKHPILADALLIQGRIQARQGKFALAQTSLDAAMRAAGDDKLRARVELAAAEAHFKSGEFVLAATEFRDAGEQAPELWARAKSNSALCWLHQGNFARFREDYQELSRKMPSSPLRSELALEEGLWQAAQGDTHAEATLRQFIRDFPQHVRTADAKLALAELRFARNDAAGAGMYLRAVNETRVPESTDDQADYLAIFVADSATPRDDDKVIALCQVFLSGQRVSSHLAEVRMKLGQVFFRREDFAGAQTQFETLARENPSGPLAESALFLAGQCSMKSMSSGGIDRAIELFEEVTKLNGPLKLHARLQQALAQNRLGKANEAIILYDAVLGADPPAEIKNAALAGKADNLAEMGEKERASYEQALAIYEQLIASPDANPGFRNRARYQKGRCLEALSRSEDALAAYYDLIQAGIKKPEEYYWFYKAGFDAGRLCEAQEHWKSAIGIYQKMASMDGPRASEAKERMTQIRLEHFIWE